jgi:hypothetical protein
MAVLQGQAQASAVNTAHAPGTFSLLIRSSNSLRSSWSFCYWFGPTFTHRSWEKGSGRALWGIDPDSLRGRLPGFMPDVPEVRGDFADYMGEIQAWDAAVGGILEELQAAGALADTLVVASGDNGMPGVPGGKCNLYDPGVAVPLLARGPQPRHRRRGRAICPIRIGRSAPATISPSATSHPIAGRWAAPPFPGEATCPRTQ